MFSGKFVRAIVLVVFVGVLFFPALSVAKVLPKYYPSDYSKIIEDSRSEKGLLIYSNMATDNWKPILSEFNQHYPWIKVRTLDLGSGEVIARYIAESESGISTADFLATLSANGWARVLKEKRAIRYASSEISYLPKWASLDEAVYTFSTDASIMLWNAKLLPENMVPKGMAHLAEIVQKQPDFFKGRLTTYDDTTSYGMFGTWALYKHHGEKFWDWMNIIGPLSRTEKSGGSQIEKILSGEYILSFNVGAISLALSSVKKAGKLVGWKYIEDGNIVLMRGMAIPSKAANVNSAKLLMDFILSQEGQLAITKGNFTAYRADVADKVASPSLHLERLTKIIGEKNMITVGWEPEYADEGKFKAIKERFREAYLGRKK